MHDDGTELLAYWHSMVRVCEGVLGSRDDAEDCASEALATVLDGAGLDGVENPEAFLVTIARRRATDVLRKRVRNRTRLLRLAGRCEVSTPDVAESVADEAEARWLSRRADELLSGKARAVLGVVAEGGTIDDAAARLAMTRRSAESHLHRARLVLRAARVAVPAFLVAVVRNGRRPATATSVVLATAAVFAPAIFRPEAPQAAPETRLTPVVTDRAIPGQPAPARTAPVRPRVAAKAPVRRPAEPPAATTTPTRTTRRVTLKPTESVTEVRTDAVVVVVTIEDREGSDDPVGIMTECVDRLRVDREHVGC